MSETYHKPKKCVGPSQLSSIVGLNKWCDRETLKKRLECGFTEQRPDCLEFGNRNEPIVRRFYERKKGVTVLEAPFVKAFNWRLIGKGDGLIGRDGGLEIKCHTNGSTLDSVPPYYLIQIVAYMYLYRRPWWDFVSASFTEEGRLKQCRIIRVYWKNHSLTWFNEWLPEIIKFINEVKWTG